MSPAPFDRVVHPTKGSTLRTLKMLPRDVLQSQFQAFWFSLKAAFHYLPSLPQSQRCGKKFFRCHSAYFSPPSPKTQITVFVSRTKSQRLLRLTARGEERAKCCRTQNAVTFPSAKRSLLRGE